MPLSSVTLIEVDHESKIIDLKTEPRDILDNDQGRTDQGDIDDIIGNDDDDMDDLEEEEEIDFEGL